MADRTAPAVVSAAGKHVAIVGLGPSIGAYVEVTKHLGGRRAYCDQTWGINGVGDVLACDRVIHMDDVAVQEMRAARRPQSNIANMLAWLKGHPGPIVTSVVRDGYPGLVAFPLAEVLSGAYDGGSSPYFNSTAAYAVALAIHEGAARISLFGIDYTLPNVHDGERGRACVEYWLGVAASRGIEITVPEQSTLLDACAPERELLYGYDLVDVAIGAGEAGVEVELTERADRPTADDIERAYDHAQHPNRLLARQAVSPAAGEPGTNPPDELMSGERQVAPDLGGIRADHVARYAWAAVQIVAQLGEHRAVLDAACGVGYGSDILARNGHKVTGVDRSPAAIAYARKHYAARGAQFGTMDLDGELELGQAFAAAVVFETLEHLADPLPFLAALARRCNRLLASVPNEAGFPFTGQKFHHRHYTRAELAELLTRAGWHVIEWWGQLGPHSSVTRLDAKLEPRTLVVEAVRISDVTTRA